MAFLSYNEFEKGLAKNLDRVSENAEVLIVSRSNGKDFGVMDLDKYNSIMETLHLSKSRDNRTRLDKAIEEMESGKFTRHTLVE